MKGDIIAIREANVFDVRKLEKSMQALKNGDESNFDVIYEQTHRLVYYIIYSILKNKEESEDIMQQVYMKVFEKINQYTDSPKAWISAIARNLAINQYNKLKKTQTDYLDDYEIAKLSSYDEKTPLIDFAAKVLNEEEFSIVMLSVVEGYKRREIAKLYNLSTSGVTWKLNNALEKIRKEWQDEN